MLASVLLLGALTVVLTSDLDQFSIVVGNFDDWEGTPQRAPSLLRCAVLCTQQRTEYCDGFRYGPGDLCMVFNDQNHCIVLNPPTTPSTTAVPNLDTAEVRSYTRRALTRVTDYCAPGRIAFDGSCYLRSDTPLQSRGKWNKGCLGPCSKPVSVNTEMELAFLLYHASRPAEAEWIGPVRKTTTITHGTNPDDTDFNTELVDVVQGAQANGNCISLLPDTATTHVVRGGCGDKLGAICESRQPAGLNTGCPKGWLHIENHCYWLARSPMPFDIADTLCTLETKGARLGQPQEKGVLEILRVYALSQDYSGFVWLGVHDKTESGVWESLDGAQWHLGGWSLPNESTDPSTSRCLRLSTEEKTPSLAPCSEFHASICHVPRQKPTAPLGDVMSP